MDKVREFREQTRKLECHFANIRKADCCCCSISESQCFVIVEVGRHPGISVKELAKNMRMDKSGVSRLVEELVQKEYIERSPSKEDRRYVSLSLLPQGTRRFEKIEKDMYQTFAKILQQIPEEKQEQVIEALHIYNKACLYWEENENEFADE